MLCLFINPCILTRTFIIESGNHCHYALKANYKRQLIFKISFIQGLMGVNIIYMYMEFVVPQNSVENLLSVFHSIGFFLVTVNLGAQPVALILKFVALEIF